MKRRRFFAASMAAAIGGTSCSMFKPKYKLEQKITDFNLVVTRKKPSGGSIRIGELGKTGIKVSKFTFGSHMSEPLLKHTAEREKIIREGYDLGITTFDIYEKRWEIYQYEPMGRYLKPIINNVVLSIFMDPFDGRTVEQEFNRAQRLLGRECIDMVRTFALTPEDEYWGHWEVLLRLKEKGYIRAVGMPLHVKDEIPKTLALHDTYPFDFVVFPYNFYHNVVWDGRRGTDFDPMVAALRKKGVGITTMKPLGSDHLVAGFIGAAKKLDTTGEVSLAAAAHKYVINSGLNPDTVLNGMYTMDHLYENVAAYYNPSMTTGESRLLELVRERTTADARRRLPEHYAFLNTWAPEYRGVTS